MGILLFFNMKIYIQLILFLFFQFLVNEGYSQTNLVKNASFEDTITCPNLWGYVDPYLLYWHNPTVSSPDYYNSCAPYSNGCNVPNSGVGFQNSKSGNAYSGLFCYDYVNPDTRDYIQGQLQDSLTANKTYTVSFYTNLANLCKYSISNIGAYLSSTAISSSDYYYLPYIPQIVNPSNVQLNDTVAWLQISGTFIAAGGEKYITIGNFNPDSITDTLLFNGSPFGTGKIAYYYIDDVSVVCLDCEGSGINDIANENDFKIFPNPNNGEMNFNCHLKGNDKGELIIYSLEGNRIKSLRLHPGIKTLNIDLQGLDSGMYLYEISVNGKVETKNKLTIIK